MVPDQNIFSSEMENFILFIKKFNPKFVFDPDHLIIKSTQFLDFIYFILEKFVQLFSPFYTRMLSKLRNYFSFVVIVIVFKTKQSSVLMN